MTDSEPQKNLPVETNLQILIVREVDKKSDKAMDSPLEIQIETEQGEESDVEFMSAESTRVEEAEMTVQDSLTVIDDSSLGNETDKSVQDESHVFESRTTKQDDQELNSNESQQSTESIQPSKAQVLKMKKGPPPGLLPLKPSLVNNGESRSPRQAALKSAERTKMIAKLQTSNSQSYNERDVTTLEAAQGLTDAEASNVSLQKITDPYLNICDSCKKLECLLYQTTGRHSRKELKFCNRKCVQAFFKYATLHFPHGKDDEDKDENNANNSNAKQGGINHIIVEPDIEIQTLSDEFQLDLDEANTSIASNGPLTASHIEDIETATKETLVCASCKKCLVGVTECIEWEAMEFCSDKCLRTYIKAVGFHCNHCSSQVNEQSLGKLCVRFGTVIRQFCSSDCLEKFKGKHKLCTQCQVNMVDKEKSYCSVACQELSRRLVSKQQFYGERTCAVCSLRKTIKYDIIMARQNYWICSKPCRNAFRFANKMTTLSCSICTRYFDVKAIPRFLARVNDKHGSSDVMWFCSSTCFATHLFRRRKIELCSRCQVKKYNVDMIRKPTVKTGSEVDSVFYCSLYCYTYNHLPSSVIRKRTADGNQTATKTGGTTLPAAAPVLNAVSLASAQLQVGNASLATSTIKPLLITNNVQQPCNATQAGNTTQTNLSGSAVLPIEVQHKIVTLPPKPKEMKNKAVWCRPADIEKSVSTDQGAEEESAVESKKIVYVPIPVAFYVPILIPVDAEDTRAIIRALEESEADEILREEQETSPLITEASVDENSEKQSSADGKEENKETAKSEMALEQRESRSKSEEKELVSPGKDLEKIVPSYTLGRFSSARKRSLSVSTSSANKRIKSDSGRSSSDSEECFYEPSRGSLKQEFGVKAWSTWLKHKSRLRSEKQRSTKDINTDLADFLRRLRKPTGENYRPDILLYLLYGMASNFETEHQKRNFFVDSAFLPFQEELDKHLLPFYQQVVRVVRDRDQSSLVTCLTESHLWDSRQLGVHSPMLLIFTMLFFNTKCFRLYTAEQHESLSFASIQKYTPSNENKLIDATVQKQNNLKIRQNLQAPQQCPVKLYNFYLSKCPESAKTRRDIFYLMPLEKTTPDAAWYSTQPVPREILSRMLHRVVFIEEVLRNLCASESVP